MKARYGYGPNGRALKKDGTERKARSSLSPTEKIAQLAEQEARAYGGIGRKILHECEDMAEFNSGLDIFKGWVRECKSLATEEKREARRANLQRQIDLLDAKGTAAETFLPAAQNAIESIDGLYSRIGREFQALVKSGNVTPENIAEMVDGEITSDVREIVEGSNDPEKDPLGEFRREQVETEDNETL